MSERIIFFSLAGLLIFSVACGNTGRERKSYTTLKKEINLPPVPTQGFEFFVFTDCKGTVSDVRTKVFHNNPGEFRIFSADYSKTDAKNLLESEGFQRMDMAFREWPGAIYYKGGRITDPLTYSGSADIMIHYVTNIGWFRVR